MMIPLSLTSIPTAKTPKCTFASSLEFSPFYTRFITLTYMTRSLKYPPSSHQNPTSFSLCPLCMLCLLLVLTYLSRPQPKENFLSKPLPSSRLISNISSFQCHQPAVISSYFIVPPSIYFIYYVPGTILSIHLCLTISSTPHQIYKFVETQCIYLWHLLCLTHLFIQQVLIT